MSICDNLDIFPNGEKDIHTPKKGLVLDVNEDNHDRINKGGTRVNTSSPETLSVQHVIPRDVCAVQQSVNHDEKSCNDDLHSSINTEKDIHTHEKDAINEHSCDRLNNGEKEINGQKTETLKEVICKDGNEVSDRSDIGTRSECPNNDGECINDDCDIVNTHQNNELKVI